MHQYEPTAGCMLNFVVARRNPAVIKPQMVSMRMGMCLFMIILLAISIQVLKTYVTAFLLEGMGWCYVMGQIIEAVSSKQVNQL